VLFQHRDFADFAQNQGINDKRQNRRAEVAISLPTKMSSICARL